MRDSVHRGVCLSACWDTPPPEGGTPGKEAHPSIWSMSGWYTSYWNAFLLCMLLPPATKLWQGNVFTPVCDSVHRGGSVPACTTGHMTGGPLSGWSLQGGYLGAVSVQGGLCLGGGLCPGGSLSGGSLSRGVCQGDPPDKDPHTVTSRWYVSYWNVFLCCGMRSWHLIR